RMLIPETAANDLQDLQDMLAWWRARKATIQPVNDTSTGRDTERITFHVERRLINLIRRKADLDGQTITQVVNQAFLGFFTIAANPHVVHQSLRPLFTDKYTQSFVANTLKG